MAGRDRHLTLVGHTSVQELVSFQATLPGSNTSLLTIAALSVLTLYLRLAPKASLVRPWVACLRAAYPMDPYHIDSSAASEWLRATSPQTNSAHYPY